MDTPVHLFFFSCFFFLKYCFRDLETDLIKRLLLFQYILLDFLNISHELYYCFFEVPVMVSFGETFSISL